MTTKQTPQDANEAAIGAVASTAGLGAAVFVNGKVVAWFADFTEKARDWCTENHFGQWLAWRAKAPELVPLTEAEYDAAMREAAEMATLFKDMPQAPNVLGDRRCAASSRSVQRPKGARSTDGLGLLLPPGSPLVGAVGVCGAVEQMLVCVEIIPSEVADVMREPVENAPERSGLVNDAIGFETLYDAVLNAECVGARVLRYVEAENLLFIFGQTVQSLGYAPIEAPLAPPPFYEGDSVSGDGHSKEGCRNNERKPKHRAVVLCKLKYADELEKFLAGKEQNGSHDAKRYEIAWSELQELKKCLGDFSSGHIERPNAGGEATGAASCDRSPRP